MQRYAVIVAGGTGSRMGGSLPKQFLELAGRPLYIRSMESFLSAFPDIRIILVMHAAHLERVGEETARLLPGASVTFERGGETRFHSVAGGLAHVEGPSIVFVHDAVRCLVTPGLIRCCHEHALRHGSAVPAIPVRDSMRLLGEGGSVPVDRDRLRAVQTPQTFHSDVLLPAYRQPYEAAFTDEATVVERMGRRVELLEGEETNIKVTYPPDLLVAEGILKGRIT